MGYASAAILLISKADGIMARDRVRISKYNVYGGVRFLTEWGNITRVVRRSRRII
jgi:hypothetical protein